MASERCQISGISEGSFTQIHDRLVKTKRYETLKAKMKQLVFRNFKVPRERQDNDPELSAIIHPGSIMKAEEDNFNHDVATRRQFSVIEEQVNFNVNRSDRMRANWSGGSRFTSRSSSSSDDLISCRLAGKIGLLLLVLLELVTNFSVASTLTDFDGKCLSVGLISALSLFVSKFCLRFKVAYPI